MSFSLYNRFRQLEKVRVDSSAIEGYLGATSSDGVLRTGAPLTYTDGGNYVTLDITQADTDTDGYLSSTDWNTFNGKSTLALGETQTTAYRGDRGKSAYDHIHNLTTDINHDALTNFTADEHFLQSTITEVGTIATGVWQGTTIDDAYVDFVSLPSDEELVSYWSFDEGSGSLAVDGSGQGNAGTLYPTPVLINACDALTDWSSSLGSLSIDTDDKMEGVGSLKDYVASPVINTWYSTKYDPAGSWDWSAKKHILHWLKCDRANTAFTEATLRIVDTINNWRDWNLTFSAGEWTAVKKLLSTGDAQSATPPDLALIDKVYVSFKAADTTPFYKKIDDLRIDDRPQWVDGKVGKCLDFDGEDDWVNCGENVRPVSAISVSVWLKPHAFQAAGAAISSGRSGGILLFYPSGTVVRFYVYTAAGWYFITMPQADISLDEWHHFVLTYDQTNIKIFMDGEEEKSGGLSGDITYDGKNLEIGRYVDTGPYFDGLIDEVRVYNRVLTASAVKALYLYPAGNKAVRISGRQIDGDFGAGNLTTTGTLGAGQTNLGDGGTTNYASFAADGDLTFHGTAMVAKEIEVVAMSFAPGASGATQTLLGYYSGYAYTINNDMIAQFELPHDWASGTNLAVKLYWYIDEDFVDNSGEVQWTVDWSACPIDETETVDAPTHSGSIDYGDQDIPANAKELTTTAAGTIAAASLASGDVIGLKISRVVLDTGANPTAEPVIIRAEIAYTSDRLGEVTT